MGWIWTILIGFIAGAVAKLLMPGKDPGGFIVTTLLGIAGALAATALGRALGWYQEGRGGGIHRGGPWSYPASLDLPEIYQEDSMKRAFGAFARPQKL
jgi:uncharacterized membrane protein YeaQ/YmgE (transglycosylase-associated protein family)